MNVSTYPFQVGDKVQLRTTWPHLHLPEDKILQLVGTVERCERIVVEDEENFKVGVKWEAGDSGIDEDALNWIYYYPAFALQGASRS